jgi:hypothetical protein
MPRLNCSADRGMTANDGPDALAIEAMMKRATAFVATVACLVGRAEAATITVDAVLDRADLSETNPINWSVMFTPVLTTP